MNWFKFELNLGSIIPKNAFNFLLIWSELAYVSYRGNTYESGWTTNDKQTNNQVPHGKVKLSQVFISHGFFTHFFLPKCANWHLYLLSTFFYYKVLVTTDLFYLNLIWLFISEYGFQNPKINLSIHISFNFFSLYLWNSKFEYVTRKSTHN